MLSEDACAAVRNGFEPQGGGDDAFDAMVGLLGMLKHLRTGLDIEAPAGHAVTTKGWILGQKPIVGETTASLSLNR